MTEQSEPVMSATSAAPASNAIVNPVDDGPLSPWWLRAIADRNGARLRRADRDHPLAYRNAPPIPAQRGRLARRAAVQR